MNNKEYVFAVFLGVGVIVALSNCKAQVYSQDGLPPQHQPNVQHQADEVCLYVYGKGVETNCVSTVWYVSTNILFKEPRWNPTAEEVPLGIHQACLLALTNICKEFPKANFWFIESVDLRSAYKEGVLPDGEYWYYAVTFKPQDVRIQKEFEDDMTVCPMQIVLLNGTVVSPKVVQGEQQQ